MRQLRLAPLLFAAIVASCDALTGPAVVTGPATAEDRIIARALLEEELEDHSLFISPRLLGQVATAVQVVRGVDEVTNELLTLPAGHIASSYSEVGVTVYGGDAAAVALRERIAECPEPFLTTCWQDLGEALEIVGPVTARLTYLYPTSAMIIVSVPTSVDRFALVERLDRRLAPHLSFVNQSINDARTVRLVRETPIWLFVLKRGYGDCMAGCIFERYYEYSYDPVGGNASKHREYGAPWPPPD